jgi:deoxyribodipyrimidine photolyase
MENGVPTNGKGWMRKERKRNLKRRESGKGQEKKSDMQGTRDESEITMAIVLYNTIHQHGTIITRQSQCRRVVTTFIRPIPSEQQTTPPSYVTSHLM